MTRLVFLPLRLSITVHFCCAFLSLSFASVLAAQESGNGISVGQPKVFDNRSLVSMIEQFEESLRTTQFVNKVDLASAINTFQGALVSDTSRNLEITSLPTPQIVTEATPTGGTLTPSKVTTTENAITPKPPTTDTGNGSLPDAVTKKYGIAAADLLDEQVNLTYQIFNLRMLLERSLSDRNRVGKPRLQSVLGLQISLDPPRKYKDCAAVVEIRVLPANSTEPVSLVAMMPQEKTYNVATLTTNVNQFGASAIAKVVQVGYSERHRGQTFFLVKDTDTYAFERDETAATGQAKPAVFGWIFRPVLNRPAVDAGTRQVFAVIAPPVGDSASDPAGPQQVKIAVKTYWVPFDRKSATEKGGAKKGSLRERPEAALDLFTSAELQKDLSAKLWSIEWSEYGTEGAIVSVSGDHFYSGTTAFLGGAALQNPSGGLLLKDDHYLQLVVPLRSLSFQDGKINGRYGVPAALIDSRIEPQQWKALPRWGFQGYETDWTPNPDRTSTTLAISVFTHDWKSAPDLHDHPPIVTVGSQAFPPSLSHPKPDGDCSIKDAQGKIVEPRSCLLMKVDVPNSLIAAEVPLDISVPFLGPDYHLHGFVYQPFRNVTAVKLRESDDVVLGIGGTDFPAGVMVYADKPYVLGNDPALTRIAKDLIALTLPKKTLDTVKQLVVQPPGGSAHLVAIPAAKPEQVKPMLSGAPQVAMNASTGVTYTGKNLQAIKKFTFEGETLSSEAGKAGESITVYVTRKVTAKAGTVDLLASTDDGTLIPAKLVILDAKPPSPAKPADKLKSSSPPSEN